VLLEKSKLTTEGACTLVWNPVLSDWAACSWMWELLDYVSFHIRKNRRWQSVPSWQHQHKYHLAISTMDDCLLYANCQPDN